MIQIENISKSYNSKEVLKNVTVTFDRGKVYGIAGENGSGKTTLFRCIAGLEKYIGFIKSEYENLKNHIGFLQTEPYFFSRITGNEYLQLLSNARNIKTSGFESWNIFDLPLNQYAITYSTGMKKKLALTAILLQQNDVFILDEPFNGVDIHSNIIITGIIKRLRELNKIVIISSHIFSTLNDTCDEIYLLENGVFTRKVLKEEFEHFEQEMKDFVLGNRIEKLKLQ